MRRLSLTFYSKTLSTKKHWCIKMSLQIWKEIREKLLKGVMKEASQPVKMSKKQQMFLGFGRDLWLKDAGEIWRFLKRYGTEIPIGIINRWVADMDAGLYEDFIMIPKITTRALGEVKERPVIVAGSLDIKDKDSLFNKLIEKIKKILFENLAKYYIEIVDYEELPPKASQLIKLGVESLKEFSPQIAVLFKVHDRSEKRDVLYGVATLEAKNYFPGKYITAVIKEILLYPPTKT
jgi:hypothetical protein